MNSLRTTHPTIHRQSGAVFIVMLVILIMGVTFFLVSSLSKVTLQTARNEQSADLLAQAKDVIVGYMLSGAGGIPPGWMMAPDVLDRPMSTERLPDGVTQGSNYDGMTEAGCFNINNSANTPPYTPLTATASNMRCLGRLPWKSLGMSISAPSENDPLGVMPWYAFSSNLMNASLPINSELLNVTSNWLTVRDMNGNVLSNRVAFLIIIPGPPLQGQARPSSPSLGAPSQYLDSITVPNPCTATPCVSGTYSNFNLASHDPFTSGFIMGAEQRWIDDPANPGKQIADPNYNFNDKLLYVTIDELIPLIEKRMAREVKNCLDDYAAAPGNTNHKYPWAALVSDNSTPLNRPGTHDVRFGRLPEIANTSTTSGSTPPTGPLLILINTVQTALTAYLNAPSAATMIALRLAGDALKDYTPTDPAHTAGTIADNCTLASCDTALLQSKINEALGGGTPDATMPANWSTVASCNTLFNTSYWPDWRDLVFYQVAGGFQPGPGGGGACVSCLNITGSGNPVPGNSAYHAAVIIAGKMLLGQSSRPATNNPATNIYYENNYLEVSNDHQSQAGFAPDVNFTTYKPSDTSNYSTVNDLVLCVDGKINCK